MSKITPEEEAKRIRIKAEKMSAGGKLGGTFFGQVQDKGFQRSVSRIGSGR